MTRAAGIHRETILQTQSIAYEGEARQCPHCYSIYLPFVEGCGFAYPEQSQCDECTCDDRPKPTDRVWIVVRGKRYRAAPDRRENGGRL